MPFLVIRFIHSHFWFSLIFTSQRYTFFEILQQDCVFSFKLFMFRTFSSITSISKMRYEVKITINIVFFTVFKCLSLSCQPRAARTDPSHG